MVQHESVQDEDTTKSYVEKVTKTVWSEFLSIPSENLKRANSFFSIGGTSLTAVIMSQKLDIELRIEVSVQDVFHFQYQTIDVSHA